MPLELEAVLGLGRILLGHDAIEEVRLRHLLAADGALRHLRRAPVLYFHLGCYAQKLADAGAAFTAQSGMRRATFKRLRLGYVILILALCELGVELGSRIRSAGVGTLLSVCRLMRTREEALIERLMKEDMALGLCLFLNFTRKLDPLHLDKFVIGTVPL